jgi:hypothetical protein
MPPFLPFAIPVWTGSVGVEDSIFAEKTPPVIFIGGKIRPDPDETRKAGSIRNHLG